MALKYSKGSYNTPPLSIPSPSEIDPNWDFWVENKPSGNPDAKDFSVCVQPFCSKVGSDSFCSLLHFSNFGKDLFYEWC
jgi:hypothetical protein